MFIFNLTKGIAAEQCQSAKNIQDVILLTALEIVIKMEEVKVTLGALKPIRKMTILGK